MTTAPAASPAANPVAPAIRLRSLDALRGFDMMWIVGADALGGAFAHLNGGRGSRLIATQLDHVEWAGFHFYDLIFPLFVFLIGVAITFSLNRLIATEGRAAALRRVLRRALLMFALGLFYYGGLARPFGEVRLLGVL
jgi:predicted acyltransferase